MTDWRVEDVVESTTGLLTRGRPGALSTGAEVEPAALVAPSSRRCAPSMRGSSAK